MHRRRGLNLSIFLAITFRAQPKNLSYTANAVIPSEGEGSSFRFPILTTVLFVNKLNSYPEFSLIYLHHHNIVRDAKSRHALICRTVTRCIFGI